MTQRKTYSSRRYRVASDDGRPLGLVVTWNQLAAVNDREVMDAIVEIRRGEDTWIGHDRIKRVK